jgi:type I restriction enzyme, S subunit
MIPEGWSIAKLGEVAEVLDPQPDHRTPPEISDGIPYIGVNDFLPNGEIDVQSCRKVSEEVWLKQQTNILVDEGGIIFGKIGTIGMPRILPATSIKYALSANVVLIKPKVNKYYILSCLRSEDIHNQIYKTLHTTSQPALGIKKIRELLVNIPPLLEQCKIAEMLGVWDESIDLLERLIGMVRSRKQGLMQQLLTGKKRFKEFEGSEWKKYKQNQVAHFYNGRAYKLSEWEEVGTPVIRLQNLTGTGKNFYYSNLELPEHQYVNSGDLLYMWSATFGPHIWKGERAIYHYHIWKVVCNDNLLSKNFFYFLLDFETQQKMSKSNGMGILHITTLCCG